MPPALLLDLGKIDLNHVIYGIEEIERVNPHRYEMRLLDGIVHLDTEAGTAVGFKEVTPKEFWARGHIPSRPLMPGVLIIEAAAQLASFAAKQTIRGERFIGFGGIDDVKFRGQVIPPCRLYLLGRFFERRPRRFKFAAQGVVAGQLVFHANIIGMPI